MKFDTTDNLCVNTIRTISIDMVGQANSGHPGLPLGATPLAYSVWAGHLKFHPSAPEWFDRDRFVLSAGHGSSMLYAMLHFYGYGLKMEDLKKFRQLDSLTPGHPEYGHTAGVETTTGPLGQGFANSVGLALAEKLIAEKLNTPEFPLVDHFTYVLAGDGDLMEGVSYEAASLAGTLKLGKLICLYDSNGITIEGSTNLAFTEDVKKRFLSQGWQVLEVEDGNSLEEIDAAIRKAKREAEKPSIIIAKTHIGWASPKQDKNSVHGEPLKPEEILATKARLGWPSAEPFFVPEEARARFTEQAEAGGKDHKRWLKLWKKYSETLPEKAELAKAMLGREIPEDLFKQKDSFFEKPMATREASGKIINLMAAALPGFTGGSADLGPSTKTDFTAEPERTLHFGIREHAMGSIINGLALHGGLIPFGATFLVFSDYMRPALRLAAVMNIPSVFVFTHDSIGVGEDGPTHQPVEHLMSLRLIPGLLVLRPADAWETLHAWEAAVRLKRPVCLALSRQKLPLYTQYREKIAGGVKRGAYLLRGPSTVPAIELVATGSEVSLAFEAAALLEKQGIAARIISAPSFELFREQDQAYRDSVMLPSLPKLCLEAGRTIGWMDLAGPDSAAIGIDTFGRSAPAGQVYAALGLTAEKVAEAARKMVKN
ncbi:MAG: transketolase [Elusimicrobia bacterium CG_4_10_14_0_2_um_filter_56_8]|nr:MAG: transketolase [Elusimicrobia bacterium CG1_02_56_21]PJA11548.1 MAG: transketolase [Elusimicrobia bacterium CG_4_10_14_0_2_um_filter_56_8]